MTRIDDACAARWLAEAVLAPDKNKGEKGAGNKREKGVVCLGGLQGTELHATAGGRFGGEGCRTTARVVDGGWGRWVLR